MCEELSEYWSDSSEDSLEYTTIAINTCCKNMTVVDYQGSFKKCLSCNSVLEVIESE